MLSLILSQVWPYILGAFGVILGLFYVRQTGKNAAKAEQAEQNADARKKAREVENDTASLSDSDIRRRAAKWLRNR